jgi:hypothetical protein
MGWPEHSVSHTKDFQRRNPLRQAGGRLKSDQALLIMPVLTAYGKSPPAWMTGPADTSDQARARRTRRGGAGVPASPSGCILYSPPVLWFVMVSVSRSTVTCNPQTRRSTAWP